MKVRFLLTLASLVACLCSLRAQPFYELEVLAGARDLHTGLDGPRGVGTFRYPACAVADSLGNLYVGDNDYSSGWVRKVSPDGNVRTVSPDMGPIQALVLDKAGNLIVALGTCLRKRDSQGNWSTLAGQLGSPGLSDGQSQMATMKRIGGMALAPDGTLYFTDDHENRLLRRLTVDGWVETIAGASVDSADDRQRIDGQGSQARLYMDAPVGFDAQGRVVLAGRDNRLRIATPEGTVTSVYLKRSQEEESDTSLSPAYDANSLAMGTDGGLLWLHDGLLGTIDVNGRCILRAGRHLGSQAANEPSLTGAGGSFTFGYRRYGLVELPESLAKDGWNLYLLCEDGVLLRARQTEKPASPILLSKAGSQWRYMGINRSITLRVNAVGQTALRYQWSHNGTPIPGATQPSLELKKLSESDSGLYSIALTADGILLADVEKLVVWAPPVMSLSLRHETPGGAMLWDIAGGEGRLVTVGTGGCILNSTDGDNWTRVDSGTKLWLVGICRGPTGFVVVGDQGLILLSIDGLTWRPAAASGTTERLNRVAYSGGLYIAVGEHGTILSSTDAEHWTVRHSGGGWLHGLGPRPSGADPVAALDGTLLTPNWVCAGQDGMVLMSADGMEWHAFRGPETDIECLLTDKYGKLFTAFGAEGTISVGRVSYRPNSHSFPLTTSPAYYSFQSTSLDLPVRFRGAAAGAAAGLTFILGEQGVVIACYDNYESYSVLPSFTKATLLGGAYLGNTMYILGENETILKSSPYEASRLSNLSSLGQTGSGENTLISGLSITGPLSKRLLVRGVGPALANFGVSGCAESPRLSLFGTKGETLEAKGALAEAPNKLQIISTALSLGAFPLQEEARDAAFLTELPPGTYSFHLTSTAGQGAALLEVYDANDLTSTPRLGNLSTRGRVDSSHPDLTAGLVINGQATRRILVRAIGPGLKAFGIQTPLPDPVVRVYANSNGMTATLGAWESEANPLEAKDAASAVGAFALTSGSADAAAILELPPGPCTFRASSASGKAGVLLLEIYDLP